MTLLVKEVRKPSKVQERDQRFYLSVEGMSNHLKEYFKITKSVTEEFIKEKHIVNNSFDVIINASSYLLLK